LIDCLRLRQPEQARLGVAGLGAGRDRADFDKAEAERAERFDVVAVLVQPCCKPTGLGRSSHHGAGRCLIRGASRHNRPTRWASLIARMPRPWAVSASRLKNMERMNEYMRTFYLLTCNKGQARR